MDSIVDESAIFETPLLEIDLELDTDATVYAKAEWFNLYDAPYGGGSITTALFRSADVIQIGSHTRI